MGRTQVEYVVPAGTPPVEAAGRLQRKGSGLWNWILIDSSGREIECDIDKYSIMRRLKIDARDLRILDPLLSYPSTILAREKAILLNLEVLLCDPSDDNVIPVVEELRRRLNPVNANQEEELMLQQDVEGEEDVNSFSPYESNPFPYSPYVYKMIPDFPFEFQALEVAMEAICSYLDARTTELETAFYPVLDLLTSKISSRNLDRLRNLKSQLTKLTARVQKVRDELEKLLDDHDDMANLYLSRKSAGTSPVSGSAAANWFPESSSVGPIKISRASSTAAVHGDDNDVGELEMLLELREYIDNAEGFINMQLDLFLSTGNLSLSVHAMVCGILGMSIPYDWNNNHGYLFKWAVILTSSLSGLLFVLIIAYARRKGLVISGF
ncbi:hypothetical protein Pfo_016119 [Paulownia fortunei]|nr:hypothetical protein Pfo_016119 [Paulownia fortunei]